MTRPTRVIHCFRAPLGGLFRHVCDLAEGQATAGLEVGLVCDPDAAGELERDRLAAMETVCALGVNRVSVPRLPGPGDLAALRYLRELACYLDVDVLHGHGAKGGAYSRLAARAAGALAVYTPHGGSLHYAPTSPAGAVFLAIERMLAARTDALIFESEFSREAYARKIAARPGAQRVIHNGLQEHEFEPVAPLADAADFVFVGELRHIKGIDVLLHALADLRRTRPATVLIVGEGPDEAALKALAARLGLGDDAAMFCGPMPAREAFARGRCLVVPSRAEAFPYIVLEAAAARVPTLATAVGGIPEIFARNTSVLLPGGDAAALRAAMAAHLAAPDRLHAIAAAAQASAAARFRTARMVEAVTSFYLERLHGDVGHRAGSLPRLSAGPSGGHG